MAVLAKRICPPRTTAYSEKDSGQREQKFDKARPALDSQPLGPRPESSTKTEPGVIDEDIAAADDQILTAVAKMKYLCALQFMRVERMLDIEQRTGFMLPHGYREIDALRRIVEILLEHESLNVEQGQQSERPESLSIRRNRGRRKSATT